MTDYEEQLLRELLLAAYHDIVPGASTLGHSLVRKLAAGLYARGGRIQIGVTPTLETKIFHISVGHDDTIVWTCAKLHALLGSKPHGLIGQSIYRYLSEDAGRFRREVGVPTLLREGKLGPNVTSLVTVKGDVLTGSSTSTILRDSHGAFIRTFTRLKIPLASYLAVLAG